MEYATLLTIVLALLFSMCAASSVNSFMRAPFPADVTAPPGTVDPTDEYATPDMYSDPLAPKLMMLAATLAVGAAAVLTYRRASVPAIAKALAVAGVSALGTAVVA